MNTTLLNFLKLAASAAPRPKIQEKLDLHFGEQDGKKWARFRQNLRSKEFASAVQEDERADEKLRQYSKMVHLHKTGKGPVFPIKSNDTGKRYTVKYHPDLDRYSCSCPDWTIKHSIDGGDCKHVRQVKSQAQMVKQAGLALRELLGAGRVGLQALRNEHHEEQAWHAGEVSRAHQRFALESRMRRAGG